MNTNKPNPAHNNTHSTIIEPSSNHNPDLGWNSSSNILNLSKLFTPSVAQIQLLEKGLSFIPRPSKYDWEELHRDLHRYHRRIKIIDYFHHKPNSQPKPFTHPSNWEPPTEQLTKTIQIHLKNNRQTLHTYRPPMDVPDNLSEAERKGLSSLIKNPNIVIKPADKGSKIVIMDRHQYLTEANRQLLNTQHYKPIQESIQSQTQTILRSIVQSLYSQKIITAKQRDYLYCPDKPRPRQFHLLPKIHKEPQTWTIPFEVPPGKPIVSDCNSTSYKISEYIEHFLGPLSIKNPSYVKDTYHFLDIIRPMVVPANSHLFTIDIDSLYTNKHRHSYWTQGCSLNFSKNIPITLDRTKKSSNF